MGGWGGPRSAAGPQGAAGERGYILTCYHGNGSGSVAAGRGGCSSPEMLTKGRGKGAWLQRGGVRGAASTPCLGPMAKTPSAAPEEVAGAARPAQPHISPLLPSLPSSPMAVTTGSPYVGSGGTPAKNLAETLAKTGYTGLEQSQTKSHVVPILLPPLPQPRTPPTPTNTTQHINIAFGFVFKVDKSLNQRLLRSPLRPGALLVPAGRDRGSHPASGGGTEESPGYHSPSQILSH